MGWNHQPENVKHQLGFVEGACFTVFSPWESSPFFTTIWENMFAVSSIPIIRKQLYISYDKDPVLEWFIKILPSYIGIIDSKPWHQDPVLENNPYISYGKSPGPWAGPRPFQYWKAMTFKRCVRQVKRFRWEMDGGFFFACEESEQLGETIEGGVGVRALPFFVGVWGEGSPRFFLRCVCDFGLVMFFIFFVWYGIPSRELTYPSDKASLKMSFLFPRWVLWSFPGG